ncbi:hypothetical protein CVT26_005176 [Gymnopilus dilepis]|uniref:F-box domain-containing protein n=1 Tax=Gymnopilus dilepis TaxID=231916 RepID=A0A409WHA5_9AGAR|nr:hypothetical protein CVT26_005176 [Gymnopilus dilepis]
MPKAGSFSNTLGNRRDAGRAVPICLGKVCKAWRHIAEATPQLWSLIIINANKDYLLAECQHVEQQLRKSGGTLLSIRIFANERSRRGIDDVSYQRLIRLLNEHSPRWYALDIRTPGPHWSLFQGNSQCTSNLRILRLDEMATCDFKKSFNILNVLPRPESVAICLYAISYAQVQIEWDRVTDALLGWTRVDDLLEILKQAPRMKQCRLCQLSEEDEMLFSEPFVHTSMEEISFDRSTEDETILDAFSFPTLRRFAWTDSFLPIPGIGSLFQRSSCVLRELVISDIEFIEEDLIPFLKGIPTLWDFEFAPSARQHYSPKELFRLLSTTSRISGGLSDGAFLPHLKTLKYAHPTLVDGTIWTYIPGLFGISDAFPEGYRRPLQTLYIRVKDSDVVYCDAFPYIPITPLRRIRNILKLGLELEIILSEPVTGNVFEMRESDLIELSMKYHSTRAKKKRQGRRRQNRYLI